MRQQYFSDSEWATILQTPMQAILAIILADKTDPVSFLQETQAAIQIMAAELEREDISSDLVKSVIAALKEITAQESLQGEQLLLKQQFELLGKIQTFKNVGDGQKQVMAHLNQVASILASKVTLVQAEEFKQWILAIATQVAKVLKEEGMFGIGGERISRQESGALSDIEKALNFKS
ncbi:hypothetical protein OsccyDRAFT_4591 [Leptolyngbyaceae cyanobacterium JSC-12]|nr:hypothetical protein OsccyDRAFT_4591 [Leptolyngbyaceae cyanobacterium JSC-12]